MSDIAIKADKIGKLYHIGETVRHDTIRDAIATFFHRKLKAEGRRLKAADTIWALKDVSFEIKRGEVVGIIGRNGAGKSTLLKILSRITEPAEGKAEIHGRVGSLLEVGTGFHPELTGRENIFLNGVILGMTKNEIKKKFDEIVAFAEVEKFIDTPVKRYSSGMYVRLAFAVAAHLEQEILLVDEVLAVGDAAFQKKCLGKMGDVAKEGRTVLFVSHNMMAIRGLCRRAMLLSAGQVIRDDASLQVVQEYSSHIQNKASVALKDRIDRSGEGSIRIVQIRLGTLRDPSLGYWITGEYVVAELEYECRGSRTYTNIEVVLAIRTMDESPLLYLGTKVVRNDIESINGSGIFRCEVPRLPLEPGRYLLATEVKQNGILADKVEAAAVFDVAEGDYYGTGVLWPYGGYLCNYRWSHTSSE